jgi:hypothetical protein
VSVKASRNTLAYQLYGRPLSMKVDFQCGSVRHMGQTAMKIAENYGIARVPDMAAQFYLLNHAMACLRKRYHLDEPMSDRDAALADRYNEFGARLAARMVAYTAVICVRECRHASGQKVALTDKILAGGGDHSVVDFIFSVDDDASAAMKAASTANVVLMMGPLMRGMEVVFYKGSWGSSFGGKKWGVIATTLRRCVVAEVSPEMFLDQSFALVHNGGPMFNKGMLFHTPHQDKLYTVLDVQRAGLIPAWLYRGVFAGTFTPSEELLGLAAHLIDEFGVESDFSWEAVQAAGAVQDYSGKSKVKAPVSPGSMANMIEVWKGQWVKKITRAELKKEMAA